jgi:hypothetical protein
MRISRLAATMTAAGVMVLAGATPVFAADSTLPRAATTEEPQVEPSGDPSGTPTSTDTPTPTPTTTEPEPAPTFDADITPHVFSPGDKLTLTTTGCPTVPTVEDVDGLFTGPLALEETGDQQHQGSAVTKTSLSPTKTFHVVVTCENVGSITFSAAPGQKTTKHRGQTGVVPVGGVQTGDGSSLGGNGPVLALTGGAAALVMTTALTLAYRRRKAQEDA